MEYKVCRNCNMLKPLSEYYKHKEMFDGYLNKCKECVRKRVSKHRSENLDRVREYDRNRPNKDERNDANKKRIKSLSPEKQKKYKEEKNKLLNSPEYKNKKTVNIYMNNAVRDGRLIKPKLCEKCSKYNKLEGHHDDYLRPLDVVWLCKRCHTDRHIEINEEKRRKQNV